MYLSESDGNETVDAELGDASGLAEEVDDSFVDIDDMPGRWRDQESGIGGTSTVGKMVEMTTIDNP